MGWTRETKWAQGALLTKQSLKDVYPGASETSVAIAISHSCDIANDDLQVEPAVEFVLAEPIERCDGNFTGAKNPRKLHLRILRSEVTQGLELLATQKISVQKAQLSRYYPDECSRLALGEVAILQSWLAARYKRQALPDSLQERLRPLVKKMEKEGGKKPHAVLGYWLDYQPREELPSREPYEIWLSVVYSTEDPEFEKISTSIAGNLRSTVGLDGLELVECEAYSEEEFTLKDLREKV